jgi:hypothetical protein
VLLACVLIASLGGASFAHAAPTRQNGFPVGSGSWNLNVPCNSPWIVRISDITNNMTGTSSLSSSPFSPGITENPPVSGSEGAKRWLTSSATPPGWVAPGPSCMITNSKGQVVASFVEIDNVRITATYYTETDCSSSFDPVNGGAQYTTGGTKCDITANIYSSATNSCTSVSDPGCWYRIHTEFDHDWQGAGYCGPSTACDPILAQSKIITQSTYIDVQGFVFWDPNHLTDQWHSYSGWELHALTAWRFHQSSSQADFGISANPTSVTAAVNSVGTSTITVSPVNGFTGNVALTSNNSACAFSPMTLSGGSGSSTLACTFNTAGTVTVFVTGTSGSLSHSASVTYTVTNGPDFGLSASPSALSIAQGSSGKSTITLVSLNGLAGTVSLSSTVSPTGPTVTLNPSSVSLGTGGSATSTLTISTTSTTPTGSYMVTVTGTSGSVSHSAVVSITVTSSSSQGDFAISVNPSSLTVSRSSSGTSVITLTSVKGFSGSVSLSAQVSGPHIHLNMSPSSLTLTSGGSASATLTINANHKAIPGSYTVTVTAASGSITHSAIITLTIT